MLVPLACCVLVQQTDAEVVLDISTTAELKEKQQNDNGFVGDEDKQVEWFTDQVKRLDTEGKTAGLNDNVSVAPELRSLAVGSGKGNKDGNVMGGVIAFIANDFRNSAFYQGSKGSYNKVIDKQEEINKKISSKNEEQEDRTALEALELLKNNARHTEQQLLTKAIEVYKGLSHNGADAVVHIYTHLAPCSGAIHRANCCEDYAQFASQNNEIKSFHIYFDRPTFREFMESDLINVDSKEKLENFSLILGNNTMNSIVNFLNSVTNNGKSFSSKYVNLQINKVLKEKNSYKKSLLQIASKEGIIIRHFYNIFCPDKLTEDQRTKLGEQKATPSNNTYYKVACLIQNIVIGLGMDTQEISNGNYLTEYYKDIIFKYALKSKKEEGFASKIKDRFTFHILERTKEVDKEN